MVTLGEGEYYDDATSERFSDTIRMVRGLVLAVKETMEYENTRGKFMLWSTLVSLFLDDPTCFRANASMMGYASLDVRMHKCGLGVVVYTIHTEVWQISVNAVVPVDATDTASLLTQAATYLRDAFPDHSFLTTPLHSHLPPDYVPHPKRRTLFPSPSSAKEGILLSKVGEGGKRGVRCRGVNVEGCALPVPKGEEREAILSHSPLSLFKRTDPEGKTYWHRFSCGTVVLLTNPLLPFRPPISLPPPLPERGRLRGHCLTSCSLLSDFLDSLRPFRKEEPLRILPSDKIPGQMRCLVALVGNQVFGLYDELIVSIGKLPAEVVERTTSRLLLDAHGIAHLFSVSGLYPPGPLCQSLSVCLSRCEDQKEWRMWVTRSPFVLDVLHRAPPSSVRKACLLFPSLRLPLALLLRSIAIRSDEGKGEKWSPSEEEKAKTLSTDGYPPLASEREEDDPIQWVRKRFDRLGTDAEERGNLLEEEGGRREEEEANLKKKKKRGKKKGKKGGEEWEKVEEEGKRGEEEEKRKGEGEEGTHLERVSRLSAQIGLSCELIGSGVFTSEGDLDVVVTVEEGVSLSDAYSLVARKTGWAPSYHKVTGERVAVLKGEFEGFPVDAQVRRRGLPSCEAERASERAIKFAKEVAEGADAACRFNVASLHSLFEKARLKGNRLCLLPGVAVTCMGVVLSRRGSEGGESFLSRLRFRLSTSFPVFDYDDASEKEERREEEGRCAESILVLAHEVSLASRLTAAASRHILDAIAHASSLGGRAGFRITREEWDRWRSSHMVTALRVTPKEGESSVARSLFSSLSKLDGHPLVDSLHVEEEEGGGGMDNPKKTLLLRILLRPDKEGKYSFLEGDEVTREESELVLVKRGKRSFPLLVTERDVTSQEEGKRTDMGREGSWKWRTFRLDEKRVLPNAPFLTVDMMHCFNVREWDFRKGGR